MAPYAYRCDGLGKRAGAANPNDMIYAASGEVSDRLAHAFKTPLATITLSSSGLLTAHELTGQQKNLLGLINQAANDLAISPHVFCGCPR